MAAGLSLHHPLPFVAGVFGNLISCMVLLAPVPTFYRVYKKRSTEQFQSFPYVVSLLSATLWVFYAIEKGIEAAFLLVTINAAATVVQSIYIAIFIFFAPDRAKKSTVKMAFLLNVMVFGSIVLCTSYYLHGLLRIRVLGWICVGFSVLVFAAPLSIIKQVIKTKSVEYMPFCLSFFLTLSAIAWYSYGFLTKDIYVTVPNILGFFFGMVQMALYMWYRNSSGSSGGKETAASNELARDPRWSGTPNPAQEAPEIFVDVAVSCHGRERV